VSCARTAGAARTMPDVRKSAPSARDHFMCQPPVSDRIVAAFLVESR
jgi:hypothetical protein